ncbi:hypothetical protein GGS23DRAFT_600613 [Durotheca rogersii]|uniref:uncharacterized protein n=1 Tax=Durotheca rogersii TaxID=419775 RepID=UPI00221F1C2D|nr:uncharacterized protein GGS23DRAFT_600613 [Durotheca rogersii]KAI5858257.1 hypothetical protein GGS23DRAFT_600613 [Durotheca rogersii]
MSFVICIDSPAVGDENQKIDHASPACQDKAAITTPPRAETKRIIHQPTKPRLKSSMRKVADTTVDVSKTSKTVVFVGNRPLPRPRDGHAHSQVPRHRKAQSVSISTLLRWSGSVFSRLESAVREGIVQEIRGLRMVAHQRETELHRSDVNPDNLWTQSRAGFISIDEDQRRAAESVGSIIQIVQETLHSHSGFTAQTCGCEDSSRQQQSRNWSPLSNSGTSAPGSSRKRKSDRAQNYSDNEEEHLFRRHRLPQFRCNRCGWEFQGPKELALHQRSTRPCELRAFEEQLEGVSLGQEKLLKSRKKDVTNKPEPEKWNDMYRILFPGDDPLDIPTPYYEYSEANGNRRASQSRDDPSLDNKLDISVYEAYLTSELPPALQRELERDIELQLQISDQSVRDRAVELIRSLQPKLLRAFLTASEAHLPDSEPSPPPIGGDSSPTGSAAGNWTLPPD